MGQNIYILFVLLFHYLGIPNEQVISLNLKIFVMKDINAVFYLIAF